MTKTIIRAELEKITDPVKRHVVEKLIEEALVEQAKTKLPPGFGFFFRPEKLVRDTHPLPPQ